MALPEALSDRPLGQLGGAVAAAAVVCYVGYQLVFKPLYNLFFHPLRHFPGPKLWAAYRFPHARSMISGKYHRKLLALHRRYGDIVRISPTQLSYTKPEAWKEIMGHRKKGQAENGKDPIFFKGSEAGLLAGDRERHSINRRVLSHAFSAKSMLEQQPLIQQYIDLFFQRIRQSAANSSIDIMSWYNYTTFDIIGDLAFGESFGCLESKTLNPWIAIIFDSIRQNNILTALRTFIPDIDAFALKLFPSAVEKIKARRELGEAKIAKRMSLPAQRPDFMESMVNKNKGSLTREEIYENANTLIVAGSETTATVLTFATYVLCKHPHVLAKLRAEVDAHFADESEIDMVRVQGLTYMLAVFDETLRLYPSVPINPWRRTPPEGQDIFGHFVPGNTTLTICQWAVFRNPDNFTMPDSFIPERFLEGSRFENDRMEAFQPFSYGARDCIGKNLAYTEMRIILARMIFNFDITLDERSKNWDSDLNVFLLWEKPPLYVHLTPRRNKA